MRNGFFFFYLQNQVKSSINGAMGNFSAFKTSKYCQENYEQKTLKLPGCPLTSGTFFYISFCFEKCNKKKSEQIDEWKSLNHRPLIKMFCFAGEKNE